LRYRRGEDSHAGAQHANSCPGTLVDQMKEVATVRDLANARTLLFVPGDRPERFDKAAAAGADLVIVDLEDAVRPAGKERAREEVRRWLSGNRACVRVNAVGTPWHNDDLSALRGVTAGVVLPMADDALIATAVHRTTAAPVLAIVETARGVLRCGELADAQGVVRLAFGALDLSADLGTDDPDTFAHVRTQLVLASRAAGLEGPVDSVTTNLTDGDVAGREAFAGKARGMRGKLCVHPRQVGPVAAAFAPDQAEVDWARRVLDGAQGGVAVVDGAMVDEPVLVRARRILAEA
jgi:citrate lyase subunit beta / citryl-CoA lyase